MGTLVFIVSLSYQTKSTKHTAIRRYCKDSRIKRKVQQGLNQFGIFTGTSEHFRFR